MTAGRTNADNDKEWCTPPAYVEAVRSCLGTIALDPCSNEYSVVGAEVEYRLPTDGLAESWDYPTIFVNPPYGRDAARGTSIKHWFRRCAETHVRGSSVVAIVPVATNTTYWHAYAFPVANSVCFFREPRLKFLQRGEEMAKGAPMACCAIYWGFDADRFNRAFSKLGACVRL